MERRKLCVDGQTLQIESLQVPLTHLVKDVNVMLQLRPLECFFRLANTPESGPAAGTSILPSWVECGVSALEVVSCSAQQFDQQGN